MVQVDFFATLYKIRLRHSPFIDEGIKFSIRSVARLRICVSKRSISPNSIDDFKRDLVDRAYFLPRLKIILIAIEL